MWQGYSILCALTLPLLQPIELHRGSTRRALLLVHGFSSSPAVFMRLWPALTCYDGLVAPVLPGHGESFEALRPVPAEAWLDHVRACCQRLLAQYEQLDILGFSLGGLLACQLSQEFPIRHLFLCAPSFYVHFPQTLERWLSYGLLKMGIQSLRHRGGNLYNETALELTCRRLPVQAVRTVFQFIRHFSFQPPPCPTDLFLGKHDAVVNCHRVEKLFKPLPQVKIHWLKRSAHALPLDTDWHKLAAIVTDRY